MLGAVEMILLKKARHLAELGYVDFAMDVYGKGVLGDGLESNRKLMQPFMEDRKMLVRRLMMWLETAKQVDVVAKTKIAVMGYFL